MRKLIFFPGLFLLLTGLLLNTPLTKKEKKDAVAYLKETQKNLSREVKGLSENQLRWKPADSVWSISDCVEHIAISEKLLFDWAIGTLKENADPAKRSSLKHSDEDVKRMMADRSNKVKTRENFKPTGQFGSTAQTLSVFNERRAATINYIKNTDDDLRNHFAMSAAGLLDSYQLILLLSGHAQRHILQIAEVKAHPGFPRE